MNLIEDRSMELTPVLVFWWLVCPGLVRSYSVGNGTEVHEPSTTFGITSSPTDNSTDNSTTHADDDSNVAVYLALSFTLPVILLVIIVAVIYIRFRRKSRQDKKTSGKYRPVNKGRPATDSVSRYSQLLRDRYRQFINEEINLKSWCDFTLIETTSQDHSPRRADSYHIQREMENSGRTLDLTTGHTVQVEDVFSHHDKDKKVNNALVLGIGGIGKTTFTKNLVLRWAKEESYGLCRRFKFLFLLECKKYNLLIKKKTLKNLIELLQSQYILASDKDDFPRVPFDKSTTILVVVDGIDELAKWDSIDQEAAPIRDESQPAEVHYIIYNIIHGNLLPGAKVLVLSRPTKGIERWMFHRVLRLKGFDVEAIGRCISTICGEKQAVIETVQNLLLQRPFLHNHCFVPRNCVMIGRYLQKEAISQMGKDEKDYEFDRSSQVFILIVTEILNTRSEKRFQEKQRSKVAERWSGTLRKLSVMAAKGMLEKPCRYQFDQEDMGRFDIGEAEWESGLLETTADPTPIVDYKYSSRETAGFTHTSIQQFLAAVHIALTDPLKFPETLSAKDTTGELHMVLLYAIGLLSDKGKGHQFLQTIDPSSQPCLLSQKANDLMTDLASQVTNEAPLEKSSVLLAIRCLVEGKMQTASPKWDDLHGCILGNENLALRLPKIPGGILPHHLAAISTYLGFKKGNVGIASQLREIDFADNDISSRGLILLKEGLLSSRKLTAIRLQGNSITDLGEFAIILKNNTGLEYLSLGSNKLGDDAAKTLKDALSCHTVLKCLRLQNNRFTADGLESLASVMEHNTNLQMLDIGINQIRDRGAKRLGSALARHTKITDLRLGENGITKDGIEALLPVFEANTSLCRLWIQRCGLHDDTVRLIVDRIKNHGDLNFLTVFGNHIGDAGARRLLELRTKHKGLRINMRENKIHGRLKREIEQEFGSQ